MEGLWLADEGWEEVRSQGEEGEGDDGVEVNGYG